jgi:protein associated with RNAse G/E
MLDNGSPVHVRKLRPDGSEVFAWDGVVLRCDEEGIVLRAEFNVDVVELGFTTFRRGDVFVEFYYWDHPYNVFQVSSPEGELKGWYANLGLPAVLDAASEELRYVDLELDIWARPDGGYQVLDEDDLERLLTQRPDLEAVAARGRAELLALADGGQLPGWP